MSTTEAFAAEVSLPSGAVVTPGDAGWDDSRQAWNLIVDQRPTAVALVESAEDVAAVVDAARRLGLRVAAQGTGHNAAPMGDLAGTILLKTERMRGVEVDAETRIARVEAGAVWLDLVQAAAAHGLATLAGSSPDVGVVGYTLGGGLSWLARSHGLCANHVEAVELVTADGRFRRVDKDSDPDLFWALRGGGGSFGIVTAVELRLLPISHVYAGILWWPVERGPEVLQTWGELTRGDVPEELTTVGRYLQLPPIPDIPEELRGKSFVVVEAIHLGRREEADELLAPLRALEPVNDTMDEIPIEALAHLHMDPEHPVPAIDDGLMLDELPPEAIDELVRVAGADSGSPLLSVEVRHVGGAASHPHPEGGATASIPAAYALLAVGMVPTPEAASAIASHIEILQATMAAWANRRMFMNFSDTSRDPSTLWSDEDYERLRTIKTTVDPGNVIRASYSVPPLA